MIRILDFRIRNCYGFVDSGAVDLARPLTFLIGRNSSGKSCFLKAITHFFDVNWNSAGTQTFGVRDLSPGDYLPALHGTLELYDLGFNGEKWFQAILQNRGHGTLDGGAANDLRESLQAFLTFCEHRPLRLRLRHLSQGRFDEAVGVDDDSRGLVEAVTKAREKLGGGGATSWAWTCLIKALRPPLLSEALLKLDGDIPEYLKDEDSQGVSAAFTDEIGRDSLRKYFKIEIPRTREPVFQQLKAKVEGVCRGLNEMSLDAPDAPLLEMSLFEGAKPGLQLELRVDGQLCRFENLSPKTKEIFGQYLMRKATPGDILLFDEPDKGFHPSAQHVVLRLLQGLAADNQLVVATHSPYMLEPEHFDAIRVMEKDDKKALRVAGSPFKAASSALALQPLHDAIGLRYRSVLEVGHNVVVVGGITDLLYLRAFASALGRDPNGLRIAPCNGDGQMRPLISLLIGQHIPFKVVADDGREWKLLQESFGLPDAVVHVIPAPAGFRDSGIEDVFARDEFLDLMRRAGLEVSDKPIPNSYLLKEKKGVRMTAKRLLAMFACGNANILAAMSAPTRGKFEAIVNFCLGGPWWTPAMLTGAREKDPD